MIFRCGSNTLDLSAPAIMGVLNVTPDSFSDGGRYLDSRAAVEHARRMIDEGAAIIDIGGDSTRPGAAPVEADEETRRVLPVIEQVARLPTIVSVDTSKPEVMRAAAESGASMINDVRALRAEGAIEAARDSRCGVCLMHMQGEPRTMQREPRYGDVVMEIKELLEERVRACTSAGIAPERIAIDPGFGFGKTAAHNLELLRRLGELTNGSHPVLVGLSRKSLVGSILGRDAGERLFGSLALAAVAVVNGARIVRAHDVAATLDVVKTANAVRTGDLT
ncbi:MAG: dihydropteroate synthase [Steroidobacteraceae bacterium]